MLSFTQVNERCRVFPEERETMFSCMCGTKGLSTFVVSPLKRIPFFFSIFQKAKRDMISRAFRHGGKHSLLLVLGEMGIPCARVESIIALPRLPEAEHFPTFKGAMDIPFSPA